MTIDIAYYVLIITGAYQQGGVLIIPRCTADNTGRYICTITLRSGETNIGYTTFTVEGGSGPGPTPGPGPGPGPSTFIIILIRWPSFWYY